MLKEVVVTKVSFDRSSLRDANIDRARDQLASQLTFVDVSSAVGQHRIQPIADKATSSHTTGKVRMDGRHSTALVAQFDFTKLFFGWTFRNEIENARRIG